MAKITFCVRGVISPLLANIYLHEVLDQWFEQDVKPRLKGTSFMVRYADDAVLGFERQEDAERVFAVLVKRFEKYAWNIVGGAKVMAVRESNVQTEEEKRKVISLPNYGSRGRGS